MGEVYIQVGNCTRYANKGQDCFNIFFVIYLHLLLIIDLFCKGNAQRCIAATACALYTADKCDIEGLGNFLTFANSPSNKFSYLFEHKYI